MGDTSDIVTFYKELDPYLNKDRERDAKVRNSNKMTNKPGSMFRVYVTDKDEKITNKSKLYSPYMVGSIYDAPYHRLGEIAKDENAVYKTLDENRFYKRADNQVFNKDGKEYIRPMYYTRRQGFSGIGKRDPNHSIYSYYDLIGPAVAAYRNEHFGNKVKASDTEDTINKKIDYLKNADNRIYQNILKQKQYAQLPDIMKRYLKILFDTTDNGLRTYDDSDISSLMRLIETLDKKQNYNSGTDYKTYTSKDKRSSVVDLMSLLGVLKGTIYATTPGNPDSPEIPVVSLVHVPENSLITVDDVASGYTAQRDFPEELVARSIVPYKLLDLSFEQDLDKLVYNKTYDKVRDRMRNTGSFDFIPENSQEEQELKEYEEQANDLFNKHGIVSDDLLSDETKKNIFKDMSNDYNKMKTQKNVNRTLKDISTF